MRQRLAVPRRVLATLFSVPTDSQHDLWNSPSDMLVDENRIAVRVGDEKATGAGSVLIDFAEELRTQRLQMKLYLANVGTRFERFGVAIQPGWKVSVFFLNMPRNNPIT